MVCIYCGGGTKVYNSRVRRRNPSVWRRRACKACVAQFSTNEQPDYTSALAVADAEHGVYPFVRDRLFLSLYHALGHRPDALHSATELTETVLGKLFRSQTQAHGMLTAGLIARVCYETLRRYDPLAAGSYKAYHAAALGEA